MSGLILNGIAESPPGLVTRSWHDDPTLRLQIPGDGTQRVTKWIRGITLHSTVGKDGAVVLPGAGTPGGAAANAHYWSKAGSSAGAHLLVDFDGSVICTADLVTEAAYHATSVNDVTVGIEIVQRNDGAFYEEQPLAVVRLVDWLTQRLGIQRQVQSPYGRNAIKRLVAGGKDVVGVFAHYHQTTARGPGDCGKFLFDRLLAAGYEGVDFERDSDKLIWRSRQASLGMAPADCDGIAGPRTVAALRAAGKFLGLRVERPGDAGLQAGT